MLYAEWTQTTVLAITAGLICWYTIETFKLRKQTVKQNEIALRPVIVPVFDSRGTERIFKLENIGVGVAFNVTVEPLIEVRPLGPGHELRHEVRFSRLSHLGNKQAGDIQFQTYWNGTLHRAPEPAFEDFLPSHGQGGKTITVVFDDVEGRRYRCAMTLLPPAQLGENCLVELMPIEKVRPGS